MRLGDGLSFSADSSLLLPATLPAAFARWVETRLDAQMAGLALSPSTSRSPVQNHYGDSSNHKSIHASKKGISTPPLHAEALKQNKPEWLWSFRHRYMDASSQHRQTSITSKKSPTNQHPVMSHIPRYFLVTKPHTESESVSYFGQSQTGCISSDLRRPIAPSGDSRPGDGDPTTPSLG